jgi:hypothetical protein
MLALIRFLAGATRHKAPDVSIASRLIQQLCSLTEIEIEIEHKRIQCLACSMFLRSDTAAHGHYMKVTKPTRAGTQGFHSEATHCIQSSK